MAAVPHRHAEAPVAHRPRVPIVGIPRIRRRPPDPAAAAQQPGGVSRQNFPPRPPLLGRDDTQQLRHKRGSPSAYEGVGLLVEHRLPGKLGRFPAARRARVQPAVQDLPAQEVRILRWRPQLAAAQGNDAAARQPDVRCDVTEELRGDDHVAERHRRAQHLARGWRGSPADAPGAHVKDDELHCEERRNHRLHRKFCVSFAK